MVADQRVYVTCHFCGNPTLKSPWEIARHDKLFCNKACYEAWRLEQSGAEERPCTNCGKLRRFSIDKLKRNSQFFCSTECRDIWRSQQIRGDKHPNWKGLVTLTCDGCGKSFQRKREKIRATQKHFCTERCMFDYMSREQRGEHHPYWSGGRFPYFGENWYEQRRKTRERDNYTCQHCSKTEQEIAKHLHVHHILPRGDGGTNELDNLISLCHSCHLKAEWAYARSKGLTLRTLNLSRPE